MTSVALKVVALGWVGGVMLIGLLINGDRLYSWIGIKFNNECDWMLNKLDVMFMTTAPKKLRTMYLCYLLSLFGLGPLLLPSAGSGAIFGLLFVFVGWKLPRNVLNLLFKRRVTRFVHQMVDGLGLMANGLRSGLNINQALSLAVEEMPNPIAQEFNLVLSQNKLGVTMEEALLNLSIRMPHDDIEMFTTSINILKETGGNLAETFDKIAYTIRERIKIESKIAAMVSQGVIQGVIVVIMPFALGAILYTIDPERIRPMFTTIPGWVLLSIMITLQFVGGWTIWKIVQVRV